MTTFLENKILTLYGNLNCLKGIAKVGDTYKDSEATYTRVDIRKNNGNAWVKE